MLRATIFGLVTSLLTVQALAQAGPVNAVIDLTVPAGQQALVDQTVFDESVSFAPNFAIDQKAPALSDLFGKDGSELCFPTSLAEALIYVQAYQSPKVQLPLAGLTTDGKSIDPNTLVRSLANACRTNVQTGTNPVNGLRCLLDVQKQAGLGSGGTTLIDPFSSDPTLPLQTRDVQIADIRNALKARHPVLLETGWFVYDDKAKTLKHDSGHFVGIYGYNYNTSWGEDQIQLKIINPLYDYGSGRETKWTTITMTRIRPQAGLIYPAHRPFTLSGSMFGKFMTRGLVGEILVVAP